MSRDPRRARVAGWDVAVGAWTVGCLAFAVWTDLSIGGLRDVSDTLVSSSRALESTALALGALRDVPVVGDEVGEIAGRIAETAKSARRTGTSSRATIVRVATLVALAIVIIAVVPTLVLYVTVRRTWVRGAGPSGP